MISIFNNPYHLAYVNTFLVLIISIFLFIYKFIFPKKNINFVFLIILVASIASWSIFRQGTYQSGDLRTHTAQLISFYNNLQQGNFIPIWSGELCGGYGCPVLEFFYILPYYIASLFHLIGFSFITSLKLLLAGSFIGSGITMFYWVKEEFGKKAGLIGTLFYLFAPYHLIDFHFRAGIGEVLSFVFIPLLFLFTKKIISTGKIKYFVLNTLSVSFLLMSHSSTFTVVVPLVIAYALLIWTKGKKLNVRQLQLFFFSLLFGILIITYYWLPALAEVKYTWYSFWKVDSFPSIFEYLYSPSRFGFLFQGNQGEYRLIIGYFHLIAIFSAIILLLKNKITKKYVSFLIFFIIVFFALFFMMLEPSRFIWQSVPFLNSFLIVWRLLIPIAFITSTIAAFLATRIKNNFILIIIGFLVVTSTLLNWGNRKMVVPPVKPLTIEVENYTEYVDSGSINSYQKFVSHDKIKSQIVASSSANKTPIEFISGAGSYIKLSKTETKHIYIIDANQNSIIRENTYYFPGWNVYVDSKENKVNHNNEYGIITFNLQKGLHKVDIFFKDTKSRELSKIISALSLVLFLLFIIVKVKKLKLSYPS